ncbi:integral membrane protein [Kwoniella heveanensis CBS 569]|nr:integral membrane protein [Kwoniella heveanensis CBS 569]
MRIPSLSAWTAPALLSLLSLLPSASAANEAGASLYTNSVSYCAEAKAVIVDTFDIAYHRHNQSATFSFSLASVESNLNVSASLYLNVYGIEAVNQTINLCDFFSGVICPLPQVNFTGYGTYPIPTKYTSQIPGIAWHIPNLEGYARVQLLREGTGEVAACLQATLSNGWSTRQTAVSWATAMFTLAALLVGLLHTGAVNSPSPAQYRWFDILFIFQAAAATGLMHLNYPLAYSAFTQNFHWALGLFRSSAVQSSINKMRSKTGGDMDSTAYPDVQYINRKFSPYNVYTSLNEVTASKAAFQNFLAENTISARSNSAAESIPHLMKRAKITSALAQNATSELSSGLPVYSNTLSISEANAFDTVFFFFLAFVAIAIAFHILLFGVLFVAEKAGRGKRDTFWATRLRRMWWDFCMGNALRVCLIWFFPIFIFGFWQFHVGDSGLSIFFAVFAILLVLVPLATVFVLSVLRHRRPSSTAPGISPLYTSYRWFHSVGVLYRAYRQKFHFYWFAPLVLAMIARAAFIAFGPTSAWAQVIGNVVVEFIILVSLLACRPHKDRKGDWISTTLSLFRLIAFGLLIAFIPSIGVKPIPRAVIGFVIIVAFGIPVILLFFGLLWNLGYGYLWRKHTHRIEDGLEVERFVASDDDSSVQPAMTQVDPVTPSYPTRDAAPSTMDGTSLARRTSIMEPVGDNVYESTYGSHHLPSFSSESTSPNRTSPINGFQQQVYNNNPALMATGAGAGGLSAAAAYEQAAKGGMVNGDGYPYEGGAGVGPGTMSRTSTATSRPLSGHSQYYTPAGGAGMYTGNGGGSAEGEEGRRHSREGDQYFPAQEGYYQNRN